MIFNVADIYMWPLKWMVHWLSTWCDHPAPVDHGLVYGIDKRSRLLLKGYTVQPLTKLVLKVLNFALNPHLLLCALKHTPDITGFPVASAWCLDKCCFWMPQEMNHIATNQICLFTPYLKRGKKESDFESFYIFIQDCLRQLAQYTYIREGWYAMW